MKFYCKQDEVNIPYNASRPKNRAINDIQMRLIYIGKPDNHLFQQIGLQGNQLAIS